MDKNNNIATVSPTLDEILQLVFFLLLIPAKIISYFLNFNPVLIYILILLSFFGLFTSLSLIPIPHKPHHYRLKDMESIIIILIIPAIIITFILKYDILFPIIYSILLIILFTYLFKKRDLIELI